MIRHNPVVGMMAKIMDADGRVRTAVDPDQVLTQLPKNPIDLAQGHGTVEPTAAAGDEKGRLLRRADVQIAPLAIVA